jgi:hypothetical protein
MKTATFLVLLLIGIFAPADNLFSYMGYKGHTLFETQSAAVYLPFRACPSEYKGDNNQCTTYNFEQDLDIYKDLDIAHRFKGNSRSFPRIEEISDREALIGWEKLNTECSKLCKSRLDYMTFEINKEPYTFMKYNNFYRPPWPDKSDWGTTVDGFDKDAYDKQYQIWEDNYYNYPKGELNDQILFAKSIWDPVNNPDHFAAEIAIRDDIPFWDSWTNVVDNAMHLAKEYKLLPLLIMSVAGLTFAGAILIFQIAIIVISGKGAKKDGRYKTGFKNNVTTADAVQSVKGPLSKLDPLRDASLGIGALCYLPFMISIPLLIPGSFASHLVEVIYFPFVMFFLGGITVLIVIPIFIFDAIFGPF